MAAPNIVNVATINGNTAVGNVSTVAANLVTNSASSGKVFKINALYISNIDSANSTSYSANVSVFRNSVEYFIAKTITVPADATLDVITKAVYLQEGDALRIGGSSNSAMQTVCSYEEIS